MNIEQANILRRGIERGLKEIAAAINPPQPKQKLQYEVTKRFRFEAAHSLPHLPEGHKCRNLHGHSYEVEIVCRGELDERGFVVDYAEIKEAFEPLRKRLDHHNVDEVVLYPSTAENLARWIYESLRGDLDTLYQIHVHETCSTRATFPVRSIG